MAEFSLFHFRIDVKQPEIGIRELLETIKPSWEPEKIQIKALSGGYSSKIFRVWNNDQPEYSMIIRIRILLDNASNFVNNFEPVALEYLSEIGRFPKMTVMFANGYGYDYIKGKPVIDARQKTGIVTDKIILATAKEMANIHNVETKILFTHNEKSVYTKLMEAFYTNNNTFEYDFVPSKETVIKEMLFLDKLRNRLKSPVGLCHGDSHFGNFIWDEEEEKITFVEWELTYVGYQYEDIAFFVQSIGLLEPFITENIEESIAMPNDTENKFLDAYFQKSCSLNTKIFSEEDLNKFKEKIRKYQLIPLFGTIIAAFVFPDLTEEFLGDLKSIFERSIKKYLQHKEEILGRKGFEI